MVRADTPAIINYQGRLEDSSGNLLGGASGTNFDFKFSIWNSATVGAGTRLWPASAPASTTHKVTEGVFDARIGDASQGFATLDYELAGYQAADLVKLDVLIAGDKIESHCGGKEVPEDRQHGRPCRIFLAGARMREIFSARTEYDRPRARQGRF